MIHEREQEKQSDDHCGDRQYCAKKEAGKADLTGRRVLLAEDVQRSMQAGLNAHLSKPVQPETLFETLENLIQK